MTGGWKKNGGASSYGELGRELREELVPKNFEFEPLPRSELENLVRDHLISQGRSESLRYWPAGRERDCVNFLRHEHSPYDDILSKARGRDGEGALTGPVRGAHEIIHRAIARAYPFLKQEAEAQFEERWSASLWNMTDPEHPLASERRKLQRLQQEAEEARDAAQKEREKLIELQHQLAEYLKNR